MKKILIAYIYILIAYIYRPICNYRLISILSPIAKIFETLLYIQIENYFSSLTIISSQQFGFRKGYSTEMAIIDLQNKFQRRIFYLLHLFRLIKSY